MSAASGIASFSSSEHQLLGHGLHAECVSLRSDRRDEREFHYFAGCRIAIAFTSQPTNTGSMSLFSPTILVSAEDSYGNLVTGYSGDISVAIGTNPSAGTLYGTLTVAASNGVSSFDDLTIDLIGSRLYTDRFGSQDSRARRVASFNITTGIPAQLSFTVQPANTAAGASISPSIQVSAQDAGGNICHHFQRKRDAGHRQ